VGKIIFLINPKSSNSKFEYINDLIEDLFDESFDYQIVVPQKRVSIENTLEELLDKDKEIETVVAAGGDGTVSSVAHCLSKTGLNMGVVPTGTANVIAKELGIPRDIRSSLEIIKRKSKVRKVDSLEVNGYHYFLRVSVGLSSLTISKINRRLKRILGSFAYLWTGIKNYFGYNHKSFDITVDGETLSYRASDIVVTNFGRIFLPGINIDPNITPDDGVLDILVFKTLSIWGTIKIIYKKLIKREKSFDELDHITEAKEVTIESSKKMPVQADGDIIGYTPITIKVVPKVLNVIVP
jgi:diacylglycerol kinase (ATP)